MNPEEIRSALQTKPFEPFRMVLTDGAAYDVQHPDLVWVGLHVLHLGFAANPESTLFERNIRIGLSHIIRLDPLEAKAKKNNGQSNS